MLVSVTLKNFGPIGEEPFEFSMDSYTNSKKNKNVSYLRETSFKKHKYLMTTSGIFGPNASGKTTLLKSIQCIKYLIQNKFKNIPDERFKLEESLKQSSSEISIRFIQNSTLYEYSIEFNKDEITKEVFQKFERKWEKILNLKAKSIDSSILNLLEVDKKSIVKLKGKKKTLVGFIQEHLKENKKEEEHIQNLFNFFDSIYILIGDKLPNNWYECIFDKNTKKDVLECLEIADFGIKDILLAEKEEFFTEEKRKEGNFLLKEFFDENKSFLEKNRKPSIFYNDNTVVTFSKKGYIIEKIKVQI